MSLRGVPAERKLWELIHVERIAAFEEERGMECKDLEGEPFGLEEDAEGDVDFS